MEPNCEDPAATVLAAARTAKVIRGEQGKGVGGGAAWLPPVAPSVESDAGARRERFTGAFKLKILGTYENKTTSSMIVHTRSFTK